MSTIEALQQEHASLSQSFEQDLANVNNIAKIKKGRAPKHLQKKQHKLGVLEVHIETEKRKLEAKLQVDISPVYLCGKCAASFARSGCIANHYKKKHSEIRISEWERFDVIDQNTNKLITMMVNGWIPEKQPLYEARARVVASKRAFEKMHSQMSPK